MPHGRDPKFADGQRVVCVHPAYGLVLGGVYTIESCWGSNPRSFNYYLAEDKSVIPYKEERFIPYDERRA